MVRDSAAIHERPGARQVGGRDDLAFGAVGVHDRRIAGLTDLVRHEIKTAQFGIIVEGIVHYRDGTAPRSSRTMAKTPENTVSFRPLR
jgi:hypothetical protein